MHVYVVFMPLNLFLWLPPVLEPGSEEPNRFITSLLEACGDAEQVHG